MTDSIAAKLRGWTALRAACSAQHKGGPGGAAVCVCGRGKDRWIRNMTDDDLILGVLVGVIRKC